MKFIPSQSATVADSSLKAAVRRMDTARHCAVLWFADMKSRGLYRELGFANMAAYATTELEFSKTRANDFLRLAAKLDGLPVVQESMASGDLGYTRRSRSSRWRPRRPRISGSPRLPKPDGASWHEKSVALRTGPRSVEPASPP